LRLKSIRQPVELGLGEDFMPKGMAAIAAAFLLAGCATVARGTSEQVQFDSEPPGATMRSIISYECGGPCPIRDERPENQTAYVSASPDGRTPEVAGPACITPCTAQVPRNQELIVTFSKEGYAPQTVMLKNHVAGGGVMGVAGNALIGGAVGAVVDVGTGAAMDHYPNPLKVVLEPVRKPIPPATQRKR
jgi:hypothetical protein